MTRFHLKRDGMPAPCKASVKACPRGGEDEHFSSLVEAAEASEARNKSAEVPATVQKRPLATRVKEAVGELDLHRDLVEEFNAKPKHFQDLGQSLVEANEAIKALEAKAKPDAKLLRQAYHGASIARTNLARALMESSISDMRLPSELETRIWARSWEEGHASGYSEVYGHYIENAELVGHAYTLGRADKETRVSA